MNNINFDLDNTIDEDFFGSLKSKSSKLQQLFVEDVLSPDDKQQSLKYQRSKDVATASNATRATLMAKVVTTYRQGELQGKVGLALIQNPDNTCDIIMYKTKTQILVTLKLEPGKQLLYKQTKYWQFYDDVSTYWSFSFNSSTDEEEFLNKLCESGIIFKENQENDQSAEKQLELPKLITEDLTDTISVCNTKGTKNSLIKRMAKMGKHLPTLSSPNQQTTTEFSDSSDTEVIRTPLASAPKPSIMPRSNKLSSTKTGQQIIPSIVGINSVSTTANAVYPINALESQYMQMLLTEQRTQGSELRININKLENKIEKVLDKLDFCNRNDGNKKTEKEDEILELEEKLLMFKKENRKLKQSLQANSLKESQEDKINDIVYELREDLKHFNIDYKQDITSIFKEMNGKLKDCRNQIKEMQQTHNENQLELEEIKLELKLKTSKNFELEGKVSLLEQEENDLKLQLIENQNETTKQKKEVLELQIKLQEKTQKTPNDAIVKSIMNNLYVDIANKLNQTNLPNSEQMLYLIASSIKEQTLQSLQQNMSTDK